MFVILRDFIIGIAEDNSMLCLLNSTKQTLKARQSIHSDGTASFVLQLCGALNEVFEHFLHIYMMWFIYCTLLYHYCLAWIDVVKSHLVVCIRRVSLRFKHCITPHYSYFVKVCCKVSFYFSVHCTWCIWMLMFLQNTIKHISTAASWNPQSAGANTTGSPGSCFTSMEIWTETHTLATQFCSAIGRVTVSGVIVFLCTAGWSIFFISSSGILHPSC